MSDFTPGAVIARGSPLWPADQMRPDWLRDDARVMMRGSVTGWWYGDPDCTNVTFFGEEVNGGADDAIRLDASDIVYRCIAWNEAHPKEPPMWPWYGGDEAPADLGDYVMFRSGDIRRAVAWSWEHKFGVADIIGYQRRPATSHPEPEEEWEGELTAEEQAMIDAAWEKHKAAGPCDRPPAGWKCSRGYGHSGPCAAVRRPDPTPIEIARAEYPDADPAMIERIVQIAKGGGE